MTPPLPKGWHWMPDLDHYRILTKWGYRALTWALAAALMADGFLGARLLVQLGRVACR